MLRYLSRRSRGLLHQVLGAASGETSTAQRLPVVGNAVQDSNFLSPVRGYAKELYKKFWKKQAELKVPKWRTFNPLEGMTTPLMEHTFTYMRKRRIPKARAKALHWAITKKKIKMGLFSCRTRRSVKVSITAAAHMQRYINNVDPRGGVIARIVSLYQQVSNGEVHRYPRGVAVWKTWGLPSFDEQPLNQPIVIARRPHIYPAMAHILQRVMSEGVVEVWPLSKQYWIPWLQVMSALQDRCRQLKHDVAFIPITRRKHLPWRHDVDVSKVDLPGFVMFGPDHHGPINAAPMDNPEQRCVPHVKEHVCKSRAIPAFTRAVKGHSWTVLGYPVYRFDRSEEEGEYFGLALVKVQGKAGPGTPHVVKSALATYLGDKGYVYTPRPEEVENFEAEQAKQAHRSYGPTGTAKIFA